MEQEKFIEHYGSLYENSPHIALEIYKQHSLDAESPLEILNLMKDYVNKMEKELKMNLILEHPELGIKKGQSKNLTAHSQKEQKRAGLDDLSSSDYSLLSELNKEYMQINQPLLLLLPLEKPPRRAFEVLSQHPFQNLFQPVLFLQNIQRTLR